MLQPRVQILPDTSEVMVHGSRPVKGSTHKGGKRSSTTLSKSKLFGADNGDVGGLKTPRRKALGDLGNRRAFGDITNSIHKNGVSGKGAVSASATKRVHRSKPSRPIKAHSLEIELGPPPRPPSPEFTMEEVEHELAECFASLLAPGQSHSHWADATMTTPPSIRQQIRELDLLTDPDEISVTGDAFETDDNFTFAEDGPIEEMDELDTEGGV